MKSSDSTSVFRGGALPNRLRNCLALLCAVFVIVPSVQAQVASVGSIERVVEKRTGAGGWANTKKGVKLGQGDGLRTGKRSKADALFRDGSLVRLGQLSSLDIESGTAEATRVRLQDGRIILVKKPSSGGICKVRTGTGAAEIKGSVVYVRVNRKDGSAEYINYSGIITVVGYNGDVETTRVAVPAGRSVKSYVGGILSPIVSATPFGAQVELIDEPVDSPFPGSKQQVISRSEPGITAIDVTLPASSPETQGNVSLNPFLPHAPLPDGQPPFGGPFPPPRPRPTPRPTPTPGTGALMARQSRQSSGQTNLPYQLSGPIRGPQAIAQLAVPVYIAQVAPPAIDSGQAAENIAITETDDFRPTYRHFDDINRQLGMVSGIDYRATGFVGDSRLLAGIGQFHGYVKQGSWSADLALNPHDIRFDTPTRRIKRSTIAVSHATLSYQAKSASLIAGRQRFLSGPIRASYFGSMTRVGGREIMDAVRLIPRINKNYGAEISYLYDAYPHELINGVRGNQQGFLGRVYTLQRFGNFGLNILRYRDSPVADLTGITLDFSVPVITKKLELYGEVGTDPFNRKLRTFGFTSPQLFQKTGFDLYVERAKLGNSASAAGVGEEWAVRLYKPLNKAVDFVGAYNRFSGGNSTFLLGISVGGQAVFPGR